jgi:hypothetical protein
MAPQMIPNYPYMTSGVNNIFSKPLIERYGLQNVIWPIVLISENQIHSYLYEVNEKTNINSQNDNRPDSQAQLINFYIDYTKDPRSIIPPSNELIELISDNYNTSYEAIVKSKEFNSVDLDYAWKTGVGWKAMEFTTLWMPLKNKREAERLIKMFVRRPSWKGTHGPHGIRILINASDDLQMNYWMVCANSVKGVSNELVTDGNAFWFQLNHENIDRIINGYAPAYSEFGTFEDLISWL